MNDKYLTKEGLEKLKKELEILKGAKRQEIAERLEKCLAFGDLTENAEYHETKEEQAFIEGRILELEELIRNATVVSKETDNKAYAQIGSTVLVSLGVKKPILSQAKSPSVRLWAKPFSISQKARSLKSKLQRASPNTRFSK